MLVLAVTVVLALLISFLCSLSEATLLSLTPSQVEALAREHPAAGERWRRFKARIEVTISAILILNTIAYTVGAAVAGAETERLFGGHGIALFSAGFTFLMLQYSEILPKTLGVRYNRAWARLIARPLDWIVWALRPIVHLLRLLNRPFAGRPGTAAGGTTLEEISALAGMARLSNVIGAHEERIIRGGARLAHMSVREVMIPMEQVTALSTAQDLVDAIIAAHLDPHTRFPVCEAGDCRRVIGYVNFKEMIYFMRTNPGEPNLRGIIRPVHYVEPEEPASELLRVFVDEHVHMAIVRDAGGRALGMITLEDIVEQLVGKLGDEFDRAPRMFHALTGGTWMVGGGLPVRELIERTGFALPEPDGALSAWLIRRMGRVPKPGDTLREGEVEFQIRRIRRGKVFEVSIARVGQSHPGMPAPVVVKG